MGRIFNDGGRIMDVLFFNDFIGYLIDVCKHFKVRFNDNYVSAMCEDGTWKDFSYEQFKMIYISSFIETMMSCDE